MLPSVSSVSVLWSPRWGFPWWLAAFVGSVGEGVLFGARPLGVVAPAFGVPGGLWRWVWWWLLALGCPVVSVGRC
ncbi:hypothetical protein [Mycobacteroides abscessus]|uniref:hypothetical protein n=1 Tax=Mycobacteroides abscessus TaxID=36809 RepID=UPI0034E8A88C